MFYRVTPITVEELMSCDSQEKLEKLSKSQLQIVILCPSLATKMGELKNENHEDNIFKVDKVLVMLLGVDKDQVIANNCESKLINCTIIIFTAKSCSVCQKIYVNCIVFIILV